MSPWVAALVGQEVGGYRVESYIGGGGFGMVFEATKVSTNSPFAIKILEPSSDARASAEFDGEGVLLQKLTTRSGVITWVESGTAMLPVSINGAAIQLPIKFHVMALASGALEELISDPASRAAMPWEDRLLHWRGAVLGVHQMHLSKVAHRDLKSGNCLLMVHNGNTEVRVADLGRSKDFSVPPTLSVDMYASGRGDARFAPPEYLWLQGGWTEEDFRNADLYGLGSLFVELATGHPMTALAIGSWRDARVEGAQDLSRGMRRDLGVLRPKFHRAIEHMALEVPPVIRESVVRLIRQLCDPVPSERQPKRMGKTPKDPDGGLSWLLRRADILIGSIRVDTNKTRRSKKAKRRSAS